LILWLIGGAVVGVLNVLSLDWSLGRLLHPAASLGGVALILGGAVVRWGIAAGLLLVALQRGIGAALLALGGLWLGRWVMIWRLHRHE